MNEPMSNGSQDQLQGAECGDFKTVKIEDVFPAFKVYTIYLTEMERQDKYIIEFTGEKCKVPSHKIRGLRCLKFTEAMIWDLIG